MGTRLNQLAFTDADATRLNATAKAMTGVDPDMTAIQWQVAYLATMSDTAIREYTTAAMDHLRQMEARLEALRTMIEQAKAMAAPTFEVDALQNAYDAIEAAHERVFDPTTDEAYVGPDSEA
jgi:uncharacterized protein YggE